MPDELYTLCRFSCPPLLTLLPFDENTFPNALLCQFIFPIVIKCRREGISHRNDTILPPVEKTGLQM